MGLPCHNSITTDYDETKSTEMLTVQNYTTNQPKCARVIGIRETICSTSL